MHRFGLLFFAIVLGATMLAAGLHAEAMADTWLSLFVTGAPADRSSDFIVKVKKKKKKHDDEGGGEGNNTTQQGERACPAGYKVLDKPNKYGAFCEPVEGLPAPEVEEKCKFPGEVGKPPNCSCPAGTEFLGYKGCVKVTETCMGFKSEPGGFNYVPFRDRCLNVYQGKWQDCKGSAEPGGGTIIWCCCKYYPK